MNVGFTSCTLSASSSTMHPAFGRPVLPLGSGIFTLLSFVFIFFSYSAARSEPIYCIPFFHIFRMVPNSLRKGQTQRLTGICAMHPPCSLTILNSLNNLPLKLTTNSEKFNTCLLQKSAHKVNRRIMGGAQFVSARPENANGRLCYEQVSYVINISVDYITPQTLPPDGI
jgi:hypothetical protein